MSRRSRDVVKEGYLYKCPQKEGLLKKSWNRRFFVLYKQSAHETARLEYYDDEWSYGRGENKRIIPLRDCQPSGVYQVSGDKTNPCVFEVNTAGGSHRLAGHSQPDLDSWMKIVRKVVEACQAGLGQSAPGRASVGRSMTMPTKARQAGVARRAAHVITATPSDDFSDFGGDPFLHGDSSPAHSRQPAFGSPVSSAPAMANLGPETSENLVYNSVDNVHRVRVRVKNTDSSFRLGISGDVFLMVAVDSIQLQHVSSGEMLGSWPLQYIRRYGRDSGKFSFEAGRRCGDVAGMFEFQTTYGNAIFHKCQENINLMQQRARNRTQHGDRPTMPQLAVDPFARTAATAEFPQQTPPYQGSRSGHHARQDAVDTGLATLSRSSRKQANAAAQFHTGGAHASSQPLGAHASSQPVGAHASSQPLGPQKPSRMHRSYSSDSTTSGQQQAVSTPTKQASYDALDRNSFGAAPLMAFTPSPSTPSQRTTAEIFASPYTEMQGNATAEIFASPYTEMQGNATAEIFASPYTDMEGVKSPTSAAVPKPTVQTRGQGRGQPGSRPKSFQRGFDEVANTMSALDKDLELLTEQLDAIPSPIAAKKPMTPTQAPIAAKKPMTPTQAPKPMTPMQAPGAVAPALPPEVPSPSYDTKPAKQRKRNPFASSPSMEEPSIKAAVAHPVNPFATHCSTNSRETSSPSQEMPPLPAKKNRRSVGSIADYEKYEENLAPPPIPKKEGAVPKPAMTADYEQYSGDLTPPLPAKSGSSPFGSKPDDDNDPSGYVKHIPTDRRGAAPISNYDSVNITSGPPVAAYKHSAAAAAADAPKRNAAGLPHQYGNVVHHASVDLSSVKLRSTNAPDAATTNPFASAFATQDKPPLPIAKEPMDPFSQSSDGSLTHSGYTNVRSEQRQAKHAHGNNFFQSPFEQQSSSNDAPPPPPIAKPSELSHTGYTNVSQAQVQAPGFDLDMYGSSAQANAPPPPAPKPHDLIPPQRSARQQLYPSTKDPFSNLADDSPYKNVAAGVGSEMCEGSYEAVERDDEIGADSGSDNDDPFG